MTAGRAVVLGDPGPWMCAGQTGGRVYLRVNHDWNLDREALERRQGQGAKAALSELDAQGMLDVQELLGRYAGELSATGQDAEAERIHELAAEPRSHFLMSVAESEQTDPSVSTE
jgi:glutamate synthase (NADPH) large chain